VHRLWLAYAAIALQIAAFPSGFFPWSTPDAAARALWLASYALLIWLVVANRRLPGIAVIGAGLLCNLAAILANGGLMPATRGALRAAGIHYDMRNNSISSAHPHLGWLVDRFAWPGWLPLANVFSAGDVIIGVGLLVLIVAGMRPRVSPRRLRRLLWHRVPEQIG
jgi:hypothetical protein